MRKAKIYDNAAGQLVKITDPVGISSSFEYGQADSINKMITPYGATTFTMGRLPGINSEPGSFVEARDAYGDRERVEANEYSLPETYAPIPAPPSTDGGQTTALTLGGETITARPKTDNLFWRNTYYWDKKQMAQHAGDYEKATIYNFLASTANTIAPVLGAC